MSGMFYLFFQIWVWLIVAFLVGWFAHQFLCCRNKKQETSAITETARKAETNIEPAAAAVSAPITPVISDDWKPALFTSPPEPSDDLKRIKGIGAVIEKTLNKLGVYQFEQIANWDSNNCAWVDNFLSFPGRIDREDWVEQATLLAKGETTEFSKRVDKGDISYDS